MKAHHYTEPEDILRDADIAMYQAKAKGKARYEFFDSAMHESVVQRLQMEADLRLAVEAIMDPAHESHEEMLVWVGGEFSPEHFDIKDVLFDDPKKRLKYALE